MIKIPDPILSVRDLQVQFTLRGKTLTALRGASLDLPRGQTVAIVGESGCGKSVFAKSLIGMLDNNGSITGGQILYQGQDLTQNTTEKEWLAVRGKKIAMVFQDPMSSLNPVRTIGAQIAEVITWHFGTGPLQAREQAIELLQRVGIQDARQRYYQYPHEFSGGMRQRVVIAAAIACRPEILICDEPTTALDVTVQAQILHLIGQLQDEYHMTVVYITHDLGVVAQVADWMGVMYAGQIVEFGTAREVFAKPTHPYTQALLKSLPQLGVKGHALYSIQGTPPNLFKDIRGDAFAPRNPQAMEVDFQAEPPVFPISPSHYAKTWLLHPYAGEHRRLIQEEQDQEARQIAPVEPFDYQGAKKLVEVRDLQVTFRMGRRVFHAVDRVSFDIFQGETLSLVGESGSGKTTIGRAMMRIQSRYEGDIRFGGESIKGKLSKARSRDLRARMQMIFQDPMSSLNERAKIDYIVSEGLYNNHLFDSQEHRKRKVEDILREVGLAADVTSRFPHEFSGGQRQRIGIARSLVMNPEFIIADEPISALDVSIRAQVINLLNKLKRERGLTYLFIAHDLSVVRFISDRIAVIHQGRIVELAPCEELFARPLHPYTRSLLSAVPSIQPGDARPAAPLVYDPAMHRYQEDPPAFHEILPGHFVLANRQELAGYQEEMRQ